jgi:hypothetical protein
VELATVMHACLAGVLAVLGAFLLYRGTPRQSWGPALACPRLAMVAGSLLIVVAVPVSAMDVGAASAVFLVLSAAMLAAVGLPYLAVWRHRA